MGPSNKKNDNKVLIIEEEDEDEEEEQEDTKQAANMQKHIQRRGKNKYSPNIMIHL